MKTIEIDEEVHDYLKSKAEPFVDTPNSVLRRLLFFEQNLSQQTDLHRRSKEGTMIKDSGVTSEVFMSSFLRYRYGVEFRTRSPYRTMFESEKHLIYFQNFNKAGTDNLWYRLSESSLEVLRKSRKIALVCFTNPAEKIVYEIPIKEIDNQATVANWKREYYEVNIDPATSRWRDLEWSIQQYLIPIDA